MDDAEDDAPRKPSRSRNIVGKSGTIYDRIAQARETRERVLAEREIESDGAALEATAPKDEPALKSAVEPPEARSPVAIHWKQARRGSAPLWALSVLIVAAGIGIVLWGSRPAGTTFADIVPVVALRPIAPTTVTEPATLPTLALPGSFEAPSMPVAAWTPPTRISFGEFPQSVGHYSGPMIAEPQPLRSIASFASFEAPDLPDNAWMPPKRISFAKLMETTVPSSSPLIPEPASIDVLNLRVSLNAPTTVSDESLAAIVAALSESGAEPEARRVNITISSSNVRYYHPTDQDAAEVIAMGIGAELRDFTDYEPRPPEGLVEIWLAGQEIRRAPPPRRSALQEGFDQIARDLRSLQTGLQRILQGGG